MRLMLVVGVGESMRVRPRAVRVSQGRLAWLGFGSHLRRPGTRPAIVPRLHRRADTRVGVPAAARPGVPISAECPVPSAAVRPGVPILCATFLCFSCAQPPPVPHTSNPPPHHPHHLHYMCAPVPASCDPCSMLRAHSRLIRRRGCARTGCRFWLVGPRTPG